MGQGGITPLSESDARARDIHRRAAEAFDARQADLAKKQEKLGKCTFQISPGAFFQVNTKGAEVLYNIVLDRIREVTTEPKRTVLLDVCCGTGTIGLTCLKEGAVGTLVGVDISAPAIADARTNAAKNGFAAAGTTRFVAAPAEKALPATLAESSPRRRLRHKCVRVCGGGRTLT